MIQQSISGYIIKRNEITILQQKQTKVTFFLCWCFHGLINMWKLTKLYTSKAFSLYQLNLNEDVKCNFPYFYYTGIWVFQTPYWEIKLLLEIFSNCRLEVRRSRIGTGNRSEACCMAWNVVVIKFSSPIYIGIWQNSLSCCLLSL